MDAYNILFGQMDPEELKKVNKARNYSQALNLPVKDLYDGLEDVEEMYTKRKAIWKAAGHPHMDTFNPEADQYTDPFHGNNARGLAELLYPMAKAATVGAGESLLSGAYQTVGHMGIKMVDTVRYLTGDTDVHQHLDKMFRETVKKGEYFKKMAQEDGVGPITSWFMETLGSAPAGIAEFIPTHSVPGQLAAMTIHGTAAAAKAEEKGDDPTWAFFKGALERGLMGQVLHAASVLNRPARAAVMGGVFEEQARHAGVEDPAELLSAFATGGLFGVVGPKGKIGMGDLRKELGNLEMEARERVRILGEMAPGDILPGERGSATGNYLGEPDLTMTRAIRVGKDIYPVEEGSDHGKTYGNIPTSKLVKAGTDLQTGWVDQTGKFYTRKEVPWERTTNMRDLTAGEKKDMGEGKAGDEISIDLLTHRFKNSEEAVDFGAKATPEQITTLKARLERGLADVAARKPAAMEALKQGDLGPLNELNKDVQQNAYAREAIETSEGAPRYGGGGEGPGGKGEGGKPPAGGEGPPGGGGPTYKVIPTETPKQYSKVLWAKKGQQKAVDPHGKDLLHDITEVEVGVEGETGKPGGKKKYLWEVTKEEGEALLKANGLSPELHKLAIDKAMLQGKKVPLEAMRGHFPEGDLLVAEGVDGIFGMKEKDMQDWLNKKTDAALIYEHTRDLLTESERRGIKARAREATGQTPASAIIEMREDQLLRNQLKMEAMAAKIAFRTGNKEGKLIHAKRFHEAIEMARARGDARSEINYMIKELRTVDPDKMTAFTSDEVRRLLDDLDLSKLSSNKRIQLEKTIEHLSRHPDTELPDYVFDDLYRLNKTPIRDLSYQEIVSIHKAVMSLVAQSDRVQSLVVKMRKVKTEKAIRDSIREMKDPDYVMEDIISTRPTMMDKVKGVGHWIKVNLGLRQDSFDLVVESLAGADSTMYDVLYRNVKRGVVKQKEMQQKAESTVRDSLTQDGFFDTVNKPDKWMNERVKVGKWELSRGERMALYLHSLNADNRQAILESGVGFRNPPPKSGMTPNTVVQMTEGELTAIAKSLTKEEKIMVKAVQKMYAEQGVDLANEFYRLNRYRMPPQENYYPKDVMPLRRGGLDLETEEGMEAFRQFTARVGIDKSMLIERVGSTRPIYLNDLMTDVNRSVRRATAYLGLEDPMRNASQMLYDQNFKREIVDRYGRDTWVELEKGMKDIAGSYRAWTSLEKGLTKLKTNVVSSALSINPWIWLNQPFSLMTYWAYVEPRHLAKGLIDSIVHPKDTLDGLRMYSPELIDRLKTGYDRDVAAVYAAERDKTFYKGESTLKEKGITPTKYFDLTAVVPGMKASVYKALEEFQTGELSRPVKQALNVTGEEAVNWTPEQKVAKAHEFADWVTQRTQAQSTPEHRSPISRGTPMEQMFTAFTSQTNVMLGLVRRTYRDYKRTGDREALHSMVKAWSAVFILNATAMIGIDRLRDLVYGRDSKSLVSGFIDNSASLLYFVRDLTRTITSFAEEGQRGKESTIPLARFSETVKDMAIHLHDCFSENKQTQEKAYLGLLDSMAQLASLSSGLPYQTPKRVLMSATDSNPPRKRRKGGDKDLIDELLGD